MAMVVVAAYRSVVSPGSGGDGTSSPPLGVWDGGDQLSDVARALREDVKMIVASRGCVRPDAARVAIEHTLADRGLRDWSVASAPGLGSDDCVTAALSQPDRRVLLLPARSEDLEAAIADVAARLLQHCYVEADAVALLSAALSTHERQDYVVRTDGPIGAPPELWVDTVRHVEAGCFVYSGAGWLPDGTPVYFLAGPRR